MGMTSALGKTLSKTNLNISAITRVPMMKYTPLNLKAGNPIMRAKAVAAKPPLKMARGRGNP
jgi:hypothetical protein